MTFEYELPDGQTHTIENNSVIIVGANGSGKSRLGAWIEEQDGNNGNIHRISGQRILNFNKFIPLKQQEAAEKELLFGNDRYLDKSNKWGQTEEGKLKYTTGASQDADRVLSLVFAKKANQDSDFREKCRKADSENMERPPILDDVIDEIIHVWKEVFPHRNIILKDSKIKAQIPDSVNPYDGTEMSDGEKASLYLIAQCLSVPSGKTIIVDEPELHLHRSIMNKLWSEIEKVRNDCLFIYITHDANFVGNHRNSDKIWVKSFDGTNWDFEFIKDSELPQQLLVDILGNRQKVIFVEGAGTSYDTELYSEFYSEYYVIPCGSCSSVIRMTKAMKAEPQLHNIECFGIVDRDYRPDEEITALENSGIFILQVAEVENLFCVEEILRIINAHQNNNNDDKISQSIEYIKTHFETKKISQIQAATLAEVKFRINGCVNKTAVLEVLNSYDSIEVEMTKRLNVNLDTVSILRVLNCKALATEIGHIFGFDKAEKGKAYKSLVARLFRGDKHTEIKESLKPYMPSNDHIPYEN
ncbi:MAG: DUF4435 domain-containing protein [Bacteroidales bacterium]|jgi:ABC-type lipoprotein export system ATPase subunit|nr:DUF4435 domain-containing protein [Bacteroidales bacterium]